MKGMGESLDRGHVMIFSLWDDVEVNMLWLDSAYPLTKPGLFLESNAVIALEETRVHRPICGTTFQMAMSPSKMLPLARLGRLLCQTIRQLLLLQVHHAAACLLMALISRNVLEIPKQSASK